MEIYVSMINLCASFFKKIFIVIFFYLILIHMTSSDGKNNGTRLI